MKSQAHSACLYLRFTLLKNDVRLLDLRHHLLALPDILRTNYTTALLFSLHHGLALQLSLPQAPEKAVKGNCLVRLRVQPPCPLLGHLYPQLRSLPNRDRGFLVRDLLSQALNLASSAPTVGQAQATQATEVASPTATATPTPKLDQFTFNA